MKGKAQERGEEQKTPVLPEYKHKLVARIHVFLAEILSKAKGNPFLWAFAAASRQELPFLLKMLDEDEKLVADILGRLRQVVAEADAEAKDNQH